ncbi:CD1375 family protein [Oscillospiraceae bacterium LCP25S3_E10]
MAMIYVSLIVKGKKTYSQVPAKLKQEVKQILIDIDCANLVEE